LVALAVAFVAISGSISSLESLRDSRTRVNQIASIKLSQTKMVNSALDYMWSKNTDRLNEYEGNRVTLNKELASYQPPNEQKTTYQDLVKENTATIVTLDQMITYRDTARDAEADTFWRTMGTQQIAHSTQLAETLNQAEEGFAQAENDRILAQVGNTIWLIGSLVGLSVLVAIGLAFLLTETFTQPIQFLKNRLNYVADGDLTQYMPISNRDELGQLAHTYNATVGSLQELIKQLFVQSQQVNTATEELTAQARNQVIGSSQQARAIEQATIALQELSVTAQEITKQSLAVVEAVEHSLEQAQAVTHLSDVMVVAQQAGRHTVARTIEAIHKLKAQMAAIENQQQALADQSDVIQYIIKLIDDIARETHLLSLNAAIEAVGAGVYGERFKEVARAIKQLASRSINSTGEVRVALEAIAQSVAQSTQLTTQGLQAAQQAVQEAEHSDITLQNLTDLSIQVKAAVGQIETYIQGSVVLANQIGSAIYQQQSANHQIFETMLQIKTVTEQNLNATKQGETATTQLGLSAQALKDRASTFVLTA
jgi:methyl-accepting chemotaxis protein